LDIFIELGNQFYQEWVQYNYAQLPFGITEKSNLIFPFFKAFVKNNIIILYITIFGKKLFMKSNLLVILVLFIASLKAQKIESIVVNLYTDSLKRGTYNYINVDGLLSNGHYLPLDSTQLIFRSSAGTFFGNSLWIDPDFKGKKISFKVILKRTPTIFKDFDIPLKQMPDGPLKTIEEIMKEKKKKSINRLNH